MSFQRDLVNQISRHIIRILNLMNGRQFHISKRLHPVGCVITLRQLGYHGHIVSAKIGRAAAAAPASTSAGVARAVAEHLAGRRRGATSSAVSSARSTGAISAPSSSHCLSRGEHQLQLVLKADRISPWTRCFDFVSR